MQQMPDTMLPISTVYQLLQVGGTTRATLLQAAVAYRPRLSVVLAASLAAGTHQSSVAQVRVDVGTS